MASEKEPKWKSCDMWLESTHPTSRDFLDDAVFQLPEDVLELSNPVEVADVAARVDCDSHRL